MRIEKLNENTKKNLLDDLLKRSPNNYGKFEASVQEILNVVKEKGDEAVFEYTEKFDGVRLDAEHLLVTEEEIAEAYEQVDDELITIIRKALVNIRDYHQKQMQYSWFDSKPDGTILGQSDSTPESRCLCSWRKSSLPIFCTYEYHAGEGCRCR